MPFWADPWLSLSQWRKRATLTQIFLLGSNSIPKSSATEGLSHCCLFWVTKHAGGTQPREGRKDVSQGGSYPGECVDGCPYSQKTAYTCLYTYLGKANSPTFPDVLEAWHVQDKVLSQGRWKSSPWRGPGPMGEALSPISTLMGWLLYHPRQKREIKSSAQVHPHSSVETAATTTNCLHL